MSAGPSLRIRPARAEDAAAVAALCGELGYPSSEQEVAARLAVLTARPDANLVLVADPGSAGRLAGWVHAERADTLLADGIVEVKGLVVAERERGRGVGTALLNAAEEWARDRGFTRVTLRSRVTREAAHRFYERRGYCVVKQQFAFSKPLVADARAQDQ